MGVSHSFISRQFVLIEGIPTTSLLLLVCVETPFGGSVALYDQCKDFGIYLVGRTFVVDLIVLDFEGFSIILGMDWLRKNHVTLDCGGRTIHIDTSSLP